MLQETHDWRGGDFVQVRGEQWKVEGGQPFQDCEVVRLVGTGRVNGGRAVSLIWPFDRPQSVATTTRVRRVRMRRWLHALRAIIAGSTPFGRLRTAAAARIDLKAWQLEPALAMLNGLAARVLLADEVGLGKTIQAGLVVSELLALVPAARVLVLTPAGLRDQWEEELRDRFAVAATIVDAVMLRRTIARLAAGTNPWSTWPVIVTSLDFAKRADVLRGVAPFTWDLLVVDEAHGCALAPERSAAVRMLAGRARRVVLVTATPHTGDDRAFASLCELGSPVAAEPEILMFRRDRSDVGIESRRRVHLLRVRCTPEEREMHRLLERYARAVWHTPASVDARLAMIVLSKRALSSAASLVRSLERRAAVLFDLPPSATQLALPFAGAATPDEETPEDAEPLGALAAPGLDDARRERDMVTQLIAASRRAAARESKIVRLSWLLRRAREPVIVFTEYRDTARSVALALEPLGSVVSLHGALGRQERRQVEREFTAGTAAILVATDAAGEGLNLHQRCRLVVNLELPWNPLRLEQRIGRVDRLGQVRRPHAVHLVASGTAEERVVERLVLRQQRARRSLGSVADVVGRRASSASTATSVTEATVMQRVMEGSGSTPPPAGGQSCAESTSPKPTCRTAHLERIAVDECRRLEEVRGLTHWEGAPSAPQPLTSGTRVTTLSRRRAGLAMARVDALRRGVLVVFVTRIINGENSVVEQWPCCLQIVGATLDEVPQLTPTLVQRATLLGAVRLATVSPIYRRVAQEAAARERVLAWAASGASLPMQPGMFDRRAIKACEQADQERVFRERDRQARAATCDLDASALRLAPPEPALVLVLPV